MKEEEDKSIEALKRFGSTDTRKGVAICLEWKNKRKRELPLSSLT
jgi:hypothetical protein